MGVLVRRDCWGYSDGYTYCNSAWYSWGRWVALAVIVAVGFIAFFLIACLNARRRRRQGLAPLPGTAWLGGPPPGHPPPHAYYGEPNYQPPPKYTPNPPAPGYYANPQHQGYFGGQQSGIELQSPPNAYHAGDPVYPPPNGPPPPKA